MTVQKRVDPAGPDHPLAPRSRAKSPIHGAGEAHAEGGGEERQRTRAHASTDQVGEGQARSPRTVACLGIVLHGFARHHGGVPRQDGESHERERRPRQSPLPGHEQRRRSGERDPHARAAVDKGVGPVLKACRIERATASAIGGGRAPYCCRQPVSPEPIPTPPASQPRQPCPRPPPRPRQPPSGEAPSSTCRPAR